MSESTIIRNVIAFWPTLGTGRSTVEFDGVV